MSDFAVRAMKGVSIDRNPGELTSDMCVVDRSTGVVEMDGLGERPLHPECCSISIYTAVCALVLVPVLPREVHTRLLQNHVGAPYISNQATVLGC